MLKMILCVDTKYGIGKNNQLPWKIKEEMNHFKNTTMNSTVVMGWNTFLSMNQKSLPHRKNIIFSRNHKKIKGAIVTKDIQKIINLSKKEDVYIIGGKQIYELFNPYCDEIILSKLNCDYDCDCFFEPDLKYFQLNKKKNFKNFSVYYYQSFYHKILDGKLVKDFIVKKLIDEKNELIKKTKIIPTLAIVQVGNNDASNVYVRNKINLAHSIGINVELHKLKEKTNQSTLNDLIITLNKNDNIHGMIVQSPLPKHLDINEVSSLIDTNKDVDCFNPFNAGLIFRNEKNKIITTPCTPAGVMELLQYYQINLKAKRVVIIGRSNLVTKPLAMLMLSNDATITICHSKTKKLNTFLKDADIICSAAGIINLISSNNIKKDSIIIDISINKYKNNNLCGDANFLAVIKKVKYITPVPGGVGQLTLAMIFKNLINLYKKQLKL